MKEIEELVKYQMEQKSLVEKELQELRAKLLWFKTHCPCYKSQDLQKCGRGERSDAPHCGCG